MNIIDTILGLFRSKAPLSQPTVDVPVVLSPFGAAYNRFGMSKQGVSQRELLGAFRSWVFLCVTIRAEAVAKARFRPYTENFREKKRIVPTRHPAQTLLDNPNPYMTRWYFQFLVSAYLDLVGHAYAYIARDRMGVPRQLWLLPPDKVRVVPSPNTQTFVERYILDIGNGAIQEFEAFEILHVKQPNPASNYFGLSTTEAAGFLVDISRGQQEYQKNFFERDAVPDYVFTHEKAIDSKTQNQFLTKWIEWYGGAKKKRRIGIIDNGLKLEKVDSVAAKDMQFVEQAKQTRDDIFAMFRVPLSYAGIGEAITARAAAESMDYKFYSSVIEPRVQMIEGQLELDLLRVWFSLDLKLTHDCIVPLDEERAMKVDAANIESGTATINEVREARGQKPVDGGDTVLVKSTLTSLENAIKEKKDPVVQPPTAPAASAEPTPPSSNAASAAQGGEE